MSTPIKTQPSNLNHLRNVNFTFNVNHKAPYLHLFVQKCNLPGISKQAISVGTKFNPFFEPSNIVDFEDLRVEFLVDEDLKNWYTLLSWMLSSSLVKDHSNFSLDTKVDCSLLIENNNRWPNIEIVYRGCFPIDLGGIDFDAGEQDPQDVVSSVTFKYDFYEVRYLS